MAGSILIHGGSKSERHNILIDKLKKIFGEESVTKKGFANLVDVMIIQTEQDRKSVGIAQIREGLKFLNEKPFNSKSKALIIYEAEKLTREAQNALLKNLEEPPLYGQIILESRTEKDLLDTVVSRCRKIDARYLKKIAQDIEFGKEEKMAVEIINMDIGQRLKIIDEIDTNDRELMSETFEKWVNGLRREMIKKPNKKFQSAINKILKYKNDLEKTNVSGKFCLETLLIDL